MITQGIIIFRCILSCILILSAVSCSTPPIHYSPQHQTSLNGYGILHQYIANITADDLGTLPGGKYSVARDINDKGDVVGGSDTSSKGELRAFLIDSHGMHNLGTLPGGGDSIAYGISSNGRFIVGSAFNKANVSHGFIDTHNNMNDLGAYPPEDNPPEPSHSVAYAVNNKGLIAGYIDAAGVIWNLYGNPNFPPFPPFTRVSDPGPFRPAVVDDINDEGQAVGEMYDTTRAFRWSSGKLVELKSIGLENRAFAVNDHGNAAGYILNGSGYPIACYWPAPEVEMTLGTMGGQYSIAEGINDNSIIVGYIQTTSGEKHAFIWGLLIGMHELGTLGGKNSEAYAINSSDVVVGESDTKDGNMHATRWKVSIKSKYY